METAIIQLKRHGILVHSINSTSGEARVNCPFCALRGKSPDIDFSAGVNFRKNVGHCFRCGWRSRHALQQFGLVSRDQAYTSSAAQTRQNKAELPDDFMLLAQRRPDIWARRAVRYLVTRGVTASEINQYDIGLSMIGRFRGRVIFPIRDRKRRLLGFTGRTILKDTEPKWLHSAGLQTMFPALWRKRKCVTLVEGVFDALAVARSCGTVTDVFAMLGTHLSEPKLEWLLDYKNVVLWTDPDKAGYRALAEISPVLQDSGCTVEVVFADKEPADLTVDAVVAGFNQRCVWSLAALHRYSFHLQAKE